MLKLKLLISLLKRNFKVLIYIALATIVVKYYFNFKQILKASERREKNLKTQMLNQWEKDSLTIVVQSEIIDSLEGVILAQAKIKIKSDTVKIETTGTKKGKRINFDWEDDCFAAWGWFEDKEPYRIQQFVNQKPYTLDIMITDLKPNIYGIVRPSSNCVNIESVNFQSAPDIKGACHDGFDKGEFFLGTGIGVGIVTLLALFK